MTAYFLRNVGVLFAILVLTASLVEASEEAAQPAGSSPKRRDVSIRIEGPTPSTPSFPPLANPAPSDPTLAWKDRFESAVKSVWPGAFDEETPEEREVYDYWDAWRRDRKEEKRAGGAAASAESSVDGAEDWHYWMGPGELGDGLFIDGSGRNWGKPFVIRESTFIDECQEGYENRAFLDVLRQNGELDRVVFFTWERYHKVSPEGEPVNPPFPWIGYRYSYEAATDTYHPHAVEVSEPPSPRRQWGSMSLKGWTHPKRPCH
jgi:hypothetical protein